MKREGWSVLLLRRFRIALCALCAFYYRFKQEPGYEGMIVHDIAMVAAAGTQTKVETGWKSKNSVSVTIGVFMKLSRMSCLQPAGS